MEIRLAVIPSASTRKLAGKLGKRHGSKFKHRVLVDNKKLTPHITLFKIDIPKKDYLQLLAVVKGFVSSTPALEVKTRGYGTPAGGWLDLEISRSSKLIRLRTQLIRKVNASGLGDLTVKSKYRPHITLAWFYRDGNNKLAVAGEPQPKITAKVKNIGLCLSRQTQVYKILDNCKLK